MQWTQDPNRSNVDYFNNIRRSGKPGWLETKWYTPASGLSR